MSYHATTGCRPKLAPSLQALRWTKAGRTGATNATFLMLQVPTTLTRSGMKRHGITSLPTTQIRESLHLGKQCALSEPSRTALYGDGGFVPGSGDTFAAQPRLVGQEPNYYNNSSAASSPVLLRLPNRFGFETCTIHTAELAAMVASLRWRSDGVWDLFVGDKSALFNALHRASDPNAPWPSK